MIIRKYTEKDISEMVRIWNEVVEDGEAFPQEEFLDDKTIISAAAATLQMQVMQWIQLTEDNISVRNL